MSGLALVTAPASEPVSLAEVRAQCRVTSNDEDALLVGYLIAARQHVENVTGRALVTQTWDYFLDRGWPLVWDQTCMVYKPRIVLPKPPVQSITSVTYVDTNGATQTLAGSNYQAVTQSTTAYLVPAYGVSWPDVRDQQNAITVRFVCGYGDNLGSAEEPIRQAIMLLVGHWFDTRTAVVVGTTPTEVPMGVSMLLSRYRVDGLI